MVLIRCCDCISFGTTGIRYINTGSKYGTQNTAAHVFRLDLKDCCTYVPPRGLGARRPGGQGARWQGARGPGGQGARGEHMTVGPLHGSKTNSRENFLFSGLFKTSKFDLDQKLCCFY